MKNVAEEELNKILFNILPHEELNQAKEEVKEADISEHHETTADEAKETR